MGKFYLRPKLKYPMMTAAAKTIRPTASNVNALKTVVCTIEYVEFAALDHPSWLTELITSEMTQMPTNSPMAPATTMNTDPVIPLLYEGLTSCFNFSNIFIKKYKVLLIYKDNPKSTKNRLFAP